MFRIQKYVTTRMLDNKAERLKSQNDGMFYKISEIIKY